jgi:hypothetical protein
LLSVNDVNESSALLDLSQDIIFHGIVGWEVYHVELNVVVVGYSLGLDACGLRQEEGLVRRHLLEHHLLDAGLARPTAKRGVRCAGIKGLFTWTCPLGKYSFYDVNNKSEVKTVPLFPRFRRQFIAVTRMLAVQFAYNITSTTTVMASAITVRNDKISTVFRVL